MFAIAKVNQQTKDNQQVAYYIQNMMEEAKERLEQLVFEEAKLQELKKDKKELRSLEKFLDEGLFEQSLESRYALDKYIYEIGIWEIQIPYEGRLQDTIGEWIKLSSNQGAGLGEERYLLDKVIQEGKMIFEPYKGDGGNTYYNLLNPFYQRDEDVMQGEVTIKWFEKEDKSYLIDELGNKREEIPLEKEGSKWGRITYQEEEKAYLLQTDNESIKGMIQMNIDLGQLKKDKVSLPIRIINQTTCGLLVKVGMKDEIRDFEMIQKLVEIQNLYQETIITYCQEYRVTSNPFIIAILVRSKQEDLEETDKVLGQMIDIYAPKGR